MVLAMSRPTKHPVTGIYQFRKAVPADLKATIGKAEVKVSLGTKDPAEAKRLHAEMAMKVARDWQLLKASETPLNQKQISALAGLAYREMVTMAEDEPGSKEAWGHVIRLSTEARQAGKLEQWVGPSVDQVLQSQGIKTDSYSRTRLIEATDRALVKAAEQIQRYAEGDWSPDINLASFPPMPVAQARTPTPATSSLSLTSLFLAWVTEAKPTKKTAYSWQSIIKHLETFLGHDDATKITRDDMVRWKDSFIQQGLSPKTINSTKLGAVSSILSLAVNNGKLPSNPADKIRVKDGEKGGGRRGFYQAETKTILTAASNDKRPFIRWLPWLAAMTGARIAELGQLRGCDIFNHEGVPVISINWEAGNLKTKGSERKVPIHPVLIRLGLLDFAKKAGSGPLFADLSPDRFNNRGGTATKRISRWMRGDLKITDRKLGPCHSWRHRFKTECRAAGVSTETSHALTGHSSGDEGSKYGEYPLKALHEAIKLLPDPLLTM